MDTPTDGILELMRGAKDASFLQELSTAIPYLSEAEQAIVRYILEHPREAAALNAAELSAATGVSQATLFRMCRQFNLGGYASLREEIQRAVERFGERFIRPTHARDLGDNTSDPLQTGMYVGMRTLLDSCNIEYPDVQRAANIIARANRLHICGMGPISGRLAEMAAFSFQRLGLTCMLWIDAQSLQREYGYFLSGDVVLALSHAGENVDIVNFLKQANANSAATIAIVNYGRSAIARVAQLPLITHSRESRVQNYDLLPRLPQLVLVQVLANMVRASLSETDQR